jgi:hypothetical protein
MNTKSQGEQMNTLKQAVKIVLSAGLLILSLGVWKQAYALTSDTMQMTVSVDNASVNYAVKITSPVTAGYDFQTVAIGATTMSTLPIAVRNVGNINEFMAVGVVDITPTYAWTNNGASLSAATTSYYMQGQFVAHGVAQPTSTAFNGATNNVPAAAPATASGTLGQGVNKTTPGQYQDLWLKLFMPTGVNDTGTHTLVLTVNGQSS